MKSFGMRLALVLGSGGLATLAGAESASMAPPVATYLDKARDQVEHGEVDRAIQTLTAAREAAPYEPAVYNALAAAYLAQGAEPMSAMQLEKSLQVDSTQIEPRLRLADIYAHNRRWLETGRQYRQVLRLDPRNDVAALQLGRLYVKAKQPAPAAQVLVGYVERHPADDDAATLYLDALVATGQDAPVANATAKLLQDRPQWTPALRAAAHAETRLGKPEAALQHWLVLDAQQALDGADAIAVGSCYVALHRDPEATQWFERGMGDKTAATSDWAEPAAAFMRQERWPQAAQCYERKVAQDSTSMSAWLNLGLCKQQMKDFTAARTALLHAVGLRPESIKVQYQLATNYVLMDSTRAARRTYGMVVRLGVGHEAECREELTQAYRYLSIAQLVDKDWDDALVSLDGVLRLEPKNAEMRLYRAQTLVALNRKSEARQEFETVLRLHPDNAQAKKGLDLLAQYN